MTTHIYNRNNDVVYVEKDKIIENVERFKALEEINIEEFDEVLNESNNKILNAYKVFKNINSTEIESELFLKVKELEKYKFSTDRFYMFVKSNNKNLTFREFENDIRKKIERLTIEINNIIETQFNNKLLFSQNNLNNAYSVIKLDKLNVSYEKKEDLNIRYDIIWTAEKVTVYMGNNSINLYDTQIMASSSNLFDCLKQNSDNTFRVVNKSILNRLH